MFASSCYVIALRHLVQTFQLLGPDSFYACYFPENEWFKLQVASVVNFFRNNGYPVEMDVMNSCELSSGPTRWAEQQIRRARNVLIFLSPGLLRLSGVDEDDPETHQVNENYPNSPC